MFSSAFKSFSSNITSNYEVSKQPTASAGVWQIFDAKKRSTGTQASVFVFDRKSLDTQSGGFGARSSATSVRRAHDQVVDRLKKEASSLARLRHPSILQLVEPVEETRNGGLMFATEPVIASLSGALAEKDDQERSSGVGGRPSRYVVEEADGTRHRRDLDIDELEIQKGLLQVAKGLEFLHDSAKLVHGNLTPDAIFINSKSDWKISGLAFAGPPDGVESAPSSVPIALSEVLHDDPRIPRSVQLNLDYSSPDFVLDSNVNASADVYSLGLVILALYNYPHKSPIETRGNQSTYKRIFNSSSTTPSPSNEFLCSRPLPRELAETLPRILARRPAQRMTASEFQQSRYFDNILVNTIRFLDALPAKTPNEKAQFMRGLGRVMPQFPASVLGKKVLAALLEEMKDKELLPLILQNVFKIINTIPSGRRVFPESVLPRLREVFLTKTKSEERDSGKEAALLIILENIQLISENCSAKEFKDDILPIIHLGMESPTHSLVDASLQSIPSILPMLDFSTVKHDLFPVVASVFSKTSSLSIKVRGLEALGILCGASAGSAKQSDDDFPGVTDKQTPSKSVSSLDKFTMQEKVVPLIKAIKTKEPAVMMAALNVFQQIGKEADAEFVAIEVMPVLWTFALGPLLNLAQFKQYMDLIKSLSSKIEREQVRKLQDLSSANKVSESKPVSTFPALANGNHLSSETGNEEDFERLVLGNRNESKNEVFPGAFSGGQKLTENPPTFSWSTVNQPGDSHRPFPTMPTLKPQPSSRSVTPDVSMSSFPALQPSGMPPTSVWSNPSSPNTAQSPFQAMNASVMANSSTQPLQPSNFSIPPPTSGNSLWQSQTLPPPTSSFSAIPPLQPQSPNIWQSSSTTPRTQPFSNTSTTAFTPSVPPPPTPGTALNTNIWQQRNPPQSQQGQPLGFGFDTTSQSPGPPVQPQKTGLDKYQSLL